MSAAAATTDSEHFTTTRVRNPRLLLAVRLAWVAIVLSSLGVFGLGVPTYLRNTASSCMCDTLMIGDDGVNVLLYPQPDSPVVGLIFDEDVLVAIDGVRLPQPAKWADALQFTDNGEPGTPVVLTVRTGDEPERDVTVNRYYNPRNLPRNLYLILDFIVIGGFAAVAFFIAFQRSDDWMVLYASAAFLGFGLANSNIYWLFSQHHQALFIPYHLIVWSLAGAYIPLFPDGRPLRGWTPLLGIAYGLWSLVVQLEIVQLDYLFFNLIDLGFVLTLFGLLRENYGKRFTPQLRQQTKWLLFGLFTLFFVRSLLFLIVPLADNLGYTLVGDVLANPIEIANRLLLLLMPLTFAFATLRYRLYDIDLVLNRSLVYGGVTLLLGGVLVLAFFALKTLWEAILGSGQEVVAAVLPAVFVTLIFNPTRKRVQHFVDRRIYRLNFDLNQLAAAQKTPEIKNPGALTGRTIGGYQVLGVLGKGGMGEVYQAHANGQSVALKILPEDLAKQSEFVSRFEREANTMRALNHPHIVKLLASGEQEGVRYLALEYVAGKDLSEHLKHNGKLAYDDARAVLRDLTSALDYAHAQGLVHRDIKPSNVMVRGDDPPQAVLMDFGIAKIKDAATRYTGSGAIGTIDYMAPEQILSAKEVDKHADVYALGVMAYEMLTGEKPFKGSAAQVMFAHLQQPPPDAHDVANDVPKSAAHAIQRALAKDPQSRYDSAGEFAAALV